VYLVPSQEISWEERLQKLTILCMAVELTH